MFEHLKLDFYVLFERFKTQIKWINDYWARFGKNEHLKGIIERFWKETAGPMDEAWSKLTPEKQNQFLKTEAEQI